jgi:cell division transport system permease protein
VFSVAVAFVCLASALLVVFNVQSVRHRWESAGQASIYLRSEASEPDIAQLQAALQKSKGVQEVRLVSSEQARSELAGSADPVLAALPDEAFPASIELKIADGQRHRLNELKAQLSSLPAVETVETYASWTERLTRLLRGGVTATALLALVIFGSVISVVSSTLRLALARRRAEVEVLRLVGANDAYVRRPFVLEGAAQGALGSLLAVLLLAGLYSLIRSTFAAELGTLTGLNPGFLPWWSILALVSVGTALGGFAAHASLRRLVSV